MLETTKCPQLAHYPTSALSELFQLSLGRTTLARWPVLSSWPWGRKTKLIHKLPQDCSLQAALGFSVHEGSYHHGLLLFPASSLQVKAQVGRNCGNRSHCLWARLHWGKGMLCPLTTPGENKAVPRFHLC